VVYFGFFCFEPKIWPDIQPPATCDIPFTAITATYVAMILVVMIPLRLFIKSKKSADPNTVSLQYGIITVIHMFLCLAWLIFALVELKDSS